MKHSSYPLLFLALVFFSSCSFFESDPAVDQAKAQALLDSMAAVDRFTRFEDLSDRRDELVTHMPYKTNDKGILVYTPLIWKIQDVDEKTGLCATVDDDATFHLVSHLRFDAFSPVTGDGLHNRIDLVIGDSLFSTGKKGYGSVQDLEGDQKIEVTSFQAADGIVIGSAIARHLKDTIEVHTFFNDREYTSYTLSYDDKKAMYDCMELSKVLAELNTLGY